jgi:hypothetical protein
VTGTQVTISDPDSNFNKIVVGNIWMIDGLTTGDSYNAQYRLLSVKEKNLNEYEMVGVEYVSQKFDGIENNASIFTQPIVNDPTNTTDLIVNSTSIPNPIPDGSVVWFSNPPIPHSGTESYDLIFYEEDETATDLRKTIILNQAIMNYILTLSGMSTAVGFLIKISVGNRSGELKYMSSSSKSSFTIFLGSQKNISTFGVEIMVYPFDKDNKLLES